MNVYYYNGQIFAKETMDGENKKKVFPLLYDTQDCDIVPFEVQVSQNGERTRELIYKKGYCGYKFPTHSEKEEKCLLYINEDKSWECKELSYFKNNIDFQENKIVLKGYLFPKEKEENLEQIQTEVVLKMKEEALDFLNAKLIQYNEYVDILHKTSF